MTRSYAERAAQASLNGQAGWFYIIQLVPDLKPERLKFGWAKNTAVRLAGHRASAPTATLLRSYPCIWNEEPDYIAKLTMEATRLTAETYDVPDVEAVLHQADKLFEWARWVFDDYEYERLITLRGDREWRRRVAEYMIYLRDPEERAWQDAPSMSRGARLGEFIVPDSRPRLIEKRTDTRQP